MSDAIVLLVVLAVFYLYDCSLWIAPDSVVFLTHGLDGWRPLRPRAVSGARRRGLLLSFRLPPLAPVYVCPAPPAGAPLRRMELHQLLAELQRFEKSTRFLQVLCNLLFVYLFVGLPIATLFWSVSRTWPALLGVLIVLVVLIAMKFRDLHTRSCPGAASERRVELAHMILYAPAAVRALDRLAHHLCAPYHPVAVAAALCAPDTLTAFAAEQLRRLEYPLEGDARPEEQRLQEKRAVRWLLAATGIDPDALLRPPLHLDASSRSYCPRCHAAYVMESGTCGDCEGVALRPYARLPETSRSMAPLERR